MATYTSNLNLKKPALDDDALITDINNNMDILDAAANGIEDALAIVANGNTHAAITSGQFVYVRNHNTLTEGLYVASSNIAANATLSSSNLAADSKGGLNALSEQITTLNSKITDDNNFINTTHNINTQKMGISGKSITVTFQITLSSDINAWSTFASITKNRPIGNIYATGFVGSTLKSFFITSGGNIQSTENIASGSSIMFSLSYMTN